LDRGLPLLQAVHGGRVGREPSSQLNYHEGRKREGNKSAV